MRTRLPSDWAIQVSEGERLGRSCVDAVVQITSPDSRTSCLIMEVKSRLEPKDIPGLIWGLRPLLNGRPRSKVFIVAPFRGPLARERLRPEDVGYADKTGNLRLVLENPPYLSSRQGRIVTLGLFKGRCEVRRRSSSEFHHHAAHGLGIGIVDERGALCSFPRSDIWCRDAGPRSPSPKTLALRPLPE